MQAKQANSQSTLQSIKKGFAIRQKLKGAANAALFLVFDASASLVSF